MSRKKLAWANKEVETFVCILGEEDVVYDVYVAAAAIDIRPTTKGASLDLGIRGYSPDTSTGCSSEYMLHRCSNIEDDRVDFCGLFCLHAVCVKPE
ncbi:unnamed protein product [Boreogadus saida]